MSDEIWDSIVESFADDSAAAFILAQVLWEFKERIRRGRGSTVVSDLERGIEKLYPYTDEYKASLVLYRVSVAGNLRPEHDPKVIADSFTSRGTMKKSSARKVATRAKKA